MSSAAVSGPVFDAERRERVRDGAAGPSPIVVAAVCSGAGRRALDYMLARIGEPLSIGRIARATGQSVRTLHRAVLAEHGVPPMALLRTERLRRARAALQAAEPRTTVTSVALRCGFTHLGRFAQSYRQRFGESPSDTLRRAREAAGSVPPVGATR